MDGVDLTRRVIVIDEPAAETPVWRVWWLEPTGTTLLLIPAFPCEPVPGDIHPGRGNQGWNTAQAAQEAAQARFGETPRVETWEGMIALFQAQEGARL